VRATVARGVIRVGHLSPAAAVIEAWSRPDTEAATAVADAATAMDEIDAGPTRIAATMLRGLLAELRWWTGDARGAREDLLRTRADVDERGERFWLPERLRLQAELSETENPTGLLDEAAAVADAQGEPPFAARARAARERVAG
jgi:hypothetical protein